MINKNIDVEHVSLLKVWCVVATSVSLKGKIFSVDEQKC